jgi:aminoglycoside phosphotransferase (APT) family kinase protein
MSQRVQTVVPERAPPFDVLALGAWLRERLPDFDGLRGISRFTGGQSNPTYLLESARRRYVMRSKPARQAQLLPSAHAVEREFRVQSALSSTRVPVARMHCSCEDESVIGRTFYVMDYVEGRIFWDPSLPGMTARERGEIYAELVRVIAELHALDVTAVGLSDYSKPGNYSRRQIERWTKQYQASETQKIEEMDRLIEWLPRNIPEQEQPEVRLVHGDYRIDNVIFHPIEPRILAVIDWELSSLGHPLADLAYFLMSWHITPGAMRGLAGQDLAGLGIPDEAACIATYERCVGRPVTGNWNFYLAYNLFRLAGIIQGIVKRAEVGTASSARAKDYAGLVRPLAQLGWGFTERAGADSTRPRGGQ